MKRCPVCNRTYTDETQNFCLEDGATLVASGSGTSGLGSMPQSGQSWQPQIPTAAPPRKKSKAWLWILGTLAVVGILCFVGLFGLLALIGSLANDNNNNNNNRFNRNTNYNANRSSNLSPNGNRAANTNSGLNPNSNLSSSPGGLKYSKMDWSKLDSEVGRGEYIGGEYQIKSKKADNYYVIIVDQAVKDEYVTKNAITKIKARSISGESPFLGYGLIVHSAPVGLKSDYAFLIRTDDDEPAYRVVKHENRNETELVEWTPAPQIKTGTQSNELEVRSDGKTLEFYINGQFATSIADKIATPGIVGLYTSGTPVIAFSDLKIYDNK
jgi:hypothetical protein